MQILMAYVTTWIPALVHTMHAGYAMAPVPFMNAVVKTLRPVIATVTETRSMHLGYVVAVVRRIWTLTEFVIRKMIALESLMPQAFATGDALLMKTVMEFVTNASPHSKRHA